MKKLLMVMGLVASLGLAGQALAFTDYGVDLNGHQCASPLLEDNTCNIIYTNDYSLIGDSQSLDVSKSSKVAQPHQEPFMSQRETRRQICRILGC